MLYYKNRSVKEMRCHVLSLVNKMIDEFSSE